MKKIIFIQVFILILFNNFNSEAQTSVSSQIASSAADAEEIISNGNVLTSDTNLEVFNTIEGIQEIGLHFKNLNVPKGAIIDSTSVEMLPSIISQAPEDSSAIYIFAEASDNPLIWSTTNKDITNRTKTNASVLLSPFDWNVIPVGAELTFKSYDISPIIQEVVNRSGYLSTDAINLIAVREYGQNQASFSYDSIPSKAAKIHVIYTPDIQAPSVPLLSSVTQTELTVDLSWAAVTDNGTVTEYKVYTGGVLEATLGNVLSYQVTGLTAATAYNFTVTALDAAGNESVVSNTLAITTNAETDTQAPTAPILSSTAQTDSSVALSWTAATDNTAVTGYKVYKDAVLETTLGNVLSYQVTGLTAVTAYNFTVTALDAAGNESVVSNTVGTTTNNAIVGNLLDTSTWTVGTGSVSGFNHVGTEVINVREMESGPHGSSVLLWKRATGVSSTSSGGFTTDYMNIDPTKTYRYTVWIKKTNSDDGRTFFGFKTKDASGNLINAIKVVNGSSSNNPYYWVGDVPSLDNWYLLVGYIHHSNYTNTTDLGGIYNVTTGNKDVGITDFKFDSIVSQVYKRTYLYDATNINDSQYFYAPAIYEVNGQEPTIQELIDGPPDTQVPTAPTLSSTAQTDTTADLSWTAATDNTAVTGYKVYKDAVLETTLGNVLSHQVTGLIAVTAYNFTVTALDAAGNESVVSNILAITTNVTSGGGSGNWTLNNQNVYYNTGNVGIGTNTPDEKLAVNGNIHAKEVRVDLSGWPDYVFTKKHKLPTLKEVEYHIKTRGHLPNIPSAKEVEENGIQLGEMNAKLLEKIEELTLYILQQQKLIEAQSKIVKEIQEKQKRK